MPKVDSKVDRESKLPAWAQLRLANLRLRIEALEGEISKALNPSGAESLVAMRRGLTADNKGWNDVPLGDEVVVFFPTTNHEIEVRPKGKRIEVRTSVGTLFLVPRTSNVAEVFVSNWSSSK